MNTPRLPAPVEDVAGRLSRLPGSVAVVLGGSRATGAHRPDSDWDLGVYYRGLERPLDPADVERLGYAGTVSGLGEWGPIVNGGAWLTVDGVSVDVLFRDLDVVERWLTDAELGRFEILAQNGYLVGAPTYVPVAELALCQPLYGDVPRPGFPEALAAAAPARWESRARVALMFAHDHAAMQDTVCCTGMLAHALLCTAHARLAARREWALNEKHLVRRAGLDGAHALLGRPGATAADLVETVAAVAAMLGIAPLSARSS